MWVAMFAAGLLAPDEDRHRAQQWLEENIGPYLPGVEQATEQGDEQTKGGSEVFSEPQ